MNFVEAFGSGLANLLTPQGLAITIGGTLLAMVVSFLPGIGTASVMAVLVVLTLKWDPVSVLLLYGALVGGATFMGSITAILFNIPGAAPNAATLIDGNPMARNGLPRTAIAAAATASATGSIFGVLFLVALLPVMRPLLLQFGPLEFVLLGIWGLVTIVAIPTSSMLKSAVMGLAGLIASMVGLDPSTAYPRWTYGTFYLEDGLSLIAVLLGLFTIAEMISWAGSFDLSPTAKARRREDSIAAGIRSVFTHIGLTLRSSMIGTVVGIIPGVGGTVASFIAYGHAVQSARRDREQFGRGDVRGLIAPEAAMDAKDGGSLLPTIAFGLPGSEGGVILITVLLIHGLVPGMPMLTTQLPMTFTIILALLFSNILTSVLGVAAAPMLGRLTRIRTDRAALAVVIISLLSVVPLRGQLGDLHVAILFGVAGYVLKSHGWPRVPFVIAFILGAMIERNFVLVERLQDLGRISFWDRPAAMIIAVLILMSAGWMLVRPRMREDKAVRAADLAIGGAVLAGAAALAFAVFRSGAEYGIIAEVVAVAALGFAAASLAADAMLLVRRHRAEGGEAAAVADASGVRRSEAVPVALLLLVIPATIVLGLGAALGLLTALWLATTLARSARGYAASAVAGLLVAAGSVYLLEEVLSVHLPRGMLFG